MVDDGPLVAAKALVKRFGAVDAVSGIDVEVQAGEAFGFLGPTVRGSPRPCG